jgi:hypothetical protein
MNPESNAKSLSPLTLTQFQQAFYAPRFLGGIQTRSATHAITMHELPDLLVVFGVGNDFATFAFLLC